MAMNATAKIWCEQMSPNTTGRLSPSRRLGSSTYKGYEDQPVTGSESASLLHAAADSAANEESGQHALEPVYHQDDEAAVDILHSGPVEDDHCWRFTSAPG